MNRYETNSKGTSPALSSILNDFANMPRSAFDETRRKSFDCSPYAIIPFECFLVFPNSEGSFTFDISVINKNPTIRRILSSMNLEVRSYIGKCSDLWEAWNNFITRGRSGKLNLKIPSIDFGKFTNGSLTIDTLLPYNPYTYLNILPSLFYHDSQSFQKNTGVYDHSSPSGYKSTGLYGSNFNLYTAKSVKEGVSALPGVMYCKVAKEFQNPNLLQNNPNWYPENENHDLILPYNCTHASNASYNNPTVFFKDTVAPNVGYDKLQPTNDQWSMPWLNVLFYKQRKGNYFYTASPFPDLLRGDVPTLDVLSANLDFSNLFETSASKDLYRLLGLVSDGKIVVADRQNNPGDPYSSSAGDILGVNIQELSKLLSDTQTATKFWSENGFGHSSNNQADYLIKSDIAKTQALKQLFNSATISGINFSLSEWRRLATLTVFRERMARTDGSYNQMIQAQFSHNPNWHEHSVRYLGGMSQPIVFSEVVQQSEDGNSPLGTTGGRFVSSTPLNENPTIHFRTDDYAIIMNVLTITPDDYFTQGISRMWSELTQSEQYFPILNNLNPQAILNKELFVSGDDSIDEDVFAYQELFSHFKSRQNEVAGLMALPISEVGEVGAYIFNRLFTSTPQFNWKFVQGELTDNENDVFASTEMAQFIVSIVSRFNYVAPMPAVSHASNMGLSYC